VSGRTAIGQLGSSDFTANIAADGTLSFQTTIFGGTSTVTIDWQLSCAQLNVINGTVHESWQDSKITGRMDVKAGLIPPTKSGSAGVTSRF